MEINFTKETVLNAKTYMPLLTKDAYAKSLANDCLDAVTPTSNEKAMAFSPLYKENNLMKAVLLQTIFMEFYFGIEVGENESPIEFYDACGENQIMNRLERFKSDPALKDRVFDILYDYKEFKKMADAEIYQEKLRRNEPIGRLLENIAQVTSPQNLIEKTKEGRELVEKIEEFKKNRKTAVDTGTADET